MTAFVVRGVLRAALVVRSTPPSPGCVVQERAVLSHCGAARVAYNWSLARVKAVLDQRAAERRYGVAEADLTPVLWWSLPALRRAWNAAKGEVAPWWAQCSKEAYNTGLDALSRALTNWADSRSGKRIRRPVGFPRFKSGRRCTPTVRFTTGAIRVEPDRKHVMATRLVIVGAMLFGGRSGSVDR